MSEETNGNGAAPDTSRFPPPEAVPPQLRTLASEIRVLENSVLLARARFAQQSGITFNGNRDEYIILGYPATITIQEYRDEYMRGGIAGRVVDVMPDATWRGQPAFELIEDEDPEVETPFENAWNKLDKKHQIGAKLLRVDKLSRLSTFGVLLLGDGQDLSTELRKTTNPDKLLYLMPFLGGGGPGGSTRENYRTSDYGSDCSIFEYDEDPKSERFGLPKTYTIRRTDLATPNFTRPVHYSRIIHVAEGLLDDDVFGQPALQRVWNLLIDLRKVTGGGAEAFWLRANQGMHIDIDKDLTLPPTENAAAVESLKAQAEDYKHQITRWIRTRGVKVTPLGSDVANFDGPADTIITQIAGAKAIPKRILTGSEMGELASSQDRENFRDQIVGRQLQYAGPYIVRQLADRLIKYGYLPEPSKGPDEYDVLWPHIQVLTEQEKIQTATGMATVNSTYGDVVFTDAEIRDRSLGFAPLSEEQRAEIDERAEAKAKQAQEAMAEMQPADVPAEDADLDFDIDDEELRAAEDTIDELRTALSKFEEHEHPRADDGKFGSGSGSADKPAGTAKRATQRSFKAGLVNLRLKLNEKETKAVEEGHARAVKAGFNGSQLEFLRQQLALSIAKGGDPVVKFDKKTVASYQALRKAVVNESKPKLGPEWKPEKSGTIDGFKNEKTGQWVPANHPIVTGKYDEAPKKEAKDEPKKEAKPKSVPASKKKPSGSKKKEAKPKEEKDPLDSIIEGMKDDERAALDEGYTKAKRDGFKGSKIDFLEEQLDLYGKAEEGDPRLKTFFYGATLDAYKKIAKNRAAMAGKTYKLSSTQIQLPPVIAEALLAFGRSIPAFDLCVEEGGLEDDAHITVKYGLHTNDVSSVRKVLATYVGPIRFTLGKTGIFEGDGYDVLYVEVISQDLVDLNERLTNNLEVTTTHPNYTPHATVAYLKQGHGVRYVGSSALEGMTASVGTIRFSPAEGEDVDLRITGREDTGKFAIVDPRGLEAAEDIELLRVLTTAIEVGATDVVHKIVGLHAEHDQKSHGNHHGGVERVGTSEGKKANYQLKVDGKSVGRIERRRQQDPQIGGPRGYNFMWHAKRGPYDTGFGHTTQEEAEKWLIEEAKKGNA